MRDWGRQRDVREFVRGLGGGSGVGGIVDSGGRGVLSSARRRWGVGRGGSLVGEAARPRALSWLSTMHLNLRQSQAPIRPLRVWLLCSGSGSVSGSYVV